MTFCHLKPDGDPVFHQCMTLYFSPTIDGYSYERSAITEWFSKGRRTSPVTNLPLTNTLLLPNRALRMVIEQQK